MSYAYILCIYKYTLTIQPQGLNIVVSLTPCLFLTPSFHCLSLLHIYIYLYTHLLYPHYIPIISPLYPHYIPIISPLYPYENSNEFHSSGESVRLMTSAPRVLKRFDRLWWQLQRGQTPGAAFRSPRIGWVKMVKGGGIHRQCWA